MNLSDRFIDLEFIYTDTSHNSSASATQENPEAMSLYKSFTLKTPRIGVKPRIDFEYKRVPGNVCYQCKVTVGNLYLQVNSIWIDEIKVTAGYLNSMSGKETHYINLTLKAFASYTPEPGPDGYTVFDCIIAEAEDSLFNTQGYALRYFLSSKHTVQYTLDYCAQKMGMTAVLHLPQSLKDTIFSAKQISEDFSTGYSLILFLQRTLNELASPLKITSQIYNDKLFFVAQDEQGKVVAPEASEPSVEDISIPELTLVSSADWNAGILTLTAPWAPSVSPGTIFYIPVSYYKGSLGLPNDVARAGSQRDSRDMYYTLLQEVKFSTIGSTNSMTISAIPVDVADVDNASRKDSTLDIRSIEEFAQAQSEARGRILIELKGEEERVVQGSKEVQDASKQLKDLTLALAEGETGRYVIKQGDTLSVLAQAGLRENGSILHRFPDLVFVNGRDEIRITGFHAGYPVLALLTYTVYKQMLAKGNMEQAKKYEIDPANPDSIRTDNFLVYTTLTWKDLRARYKDTILNLWTTCAEFYEAKGLRSWAAALREAADAWDKYAVKEEGV